MSHPHTDTELVSSPDRTLPGQRAGADGFVQQVSTPAQPTTNLGIGPLDTAPWLISPSSCSRVRPALLANNAYPAIERHANFCADARLSAVRKWLQIVAYIRGRLRGSSA